MKVKLRKSIRRSNVPEYFCPFEEFEIDCKGNGTEEDPIIIDSSTTLPLHVEIMESSKYIIVQNLNIDGLNFYYCKNIKIENLKLEFITLFNCSDISIKNVEIRYYIEMFNCINCSTKNCEIGDYEIYKCYNNRIKNNIIRGGFEDIGELSRGNTFENNDVYDPSDPIYKEIQKPILENKKTFTLFGSPDTLVELDYQSGNGSKEHPIVIDSNKIDYNNIYSNILSHQSFKSLTLSYNRHYIIFRNFNFIKLELGDCQHITFDKCNVSNLCDLRYCSDICVNFCEIKTLSFDMCQDTIFINANIERIKALKGNKGSISLKNSTVKKIDKKVPDIKWI